MLRALGLRGWEVDPILYSSDEPVWERSDALSFQVRGADESSSGSSASSGVAGLLLQGHALWNADIRPNATTDA